MISHVNNNSLKIFFTGNYYSQDGLTYSVAHWRVFFFFKSLLTVPHSVAHWRVKQLYLGVGLGSGNYHLHRKLLFT